MCDGPGWTMSRTRWALDRNELGAILVAAGLSGARDHALVSLLALNGLRVSEALGADIDALGLERGHRTLTVCHKGGKIVTMPLAPRVARAIDLAIGERPAGPIFLSVDGERLERHAAARIVRRVARRAGSTSASDPTRSATPSSRRNRRRCATARRPGGRQPRRPTHDHAPRPRPPGPRPARHPHRRHLRRHPSSPAPAAEPRSKHARPAPDFAPSTDSGAPGLMVDLRQIAGSGRGRGGLADVVMARGTARATGASPSIGRLSVTSARRLRRGIDSPA